MKTSAARGERRATASRRVFRSCFSRRSRSGSNSAPARAWTAERGSLIVEAAKQRRGHLYVDSGDCRVSVVGTIFSVNHGAKGSRVSVIEGEVHVQEGAERAVLLPGQQFASGHRLAAVAVADEISWSRDAARYRERLAALKSLGHELDLALTPESARTSTRLLDLVPPGTGIYVALPNLSQSLGTAWQIVQQRVAENPLLGEWWSAHFADPQDEAEIAQAIAELERFGGELGTEIAIALDLAAAPAGSGEVAASAPVLLAEVQDPARFSPLLDEEIARLNSLPAPPPSPGGEPDAPRLRRITDPASETAGEHQLLVWLAGDLLVASPSLASLATIQSELAANANLFVGTPFHQRLAAIYDGGAEWLVGVDLAAMIARTAEQRAGVEGHDPSLVLDRLGLADAEFLILDSRSSSGETQSRAHLAFRNERRGLASWLAEPAPVGALDFVSPSAHLAVGGVLKEPAEMLDDLLAVISADDSAGDTSALRQLADFEAEHGLSLRADLAATLGGDFAFAFDGPWLPTPSWKLVLEVNDAGRLQSTLVTMVEEWNRAAATGEGAPRPTLALSQEAVDGRVLYDLGTTTGTELAHFLFVDGYLVAGPSRALLLEAVAQRAAGITLAASAEFLDLLPLDGQANYSAVVYQNLGGAVGALGEFLGRQGGIPQAERERLTALAGEAGASLAVAYGEPQALTFATRGARGPMGISFENLLALGGLFGDHDAVQGESSPAGSSDETPAGPQA